MCTFIFSSLLSVVYVDLWCIAFSSTVFYFVGEVDFMSLLRYSDRFFVVIVAVVPESWKSSPYATSTTKARYHEQKKSTNSITQKGYTSYKWQLLRSLTIKINYCYHFHIEFFFFFVTSTYDAVLCWLFGLNEPKLCDVWNFIFVYIQYNTIG